MALRSAAAPPTWGQDMEVPDKILYFTTRSSISSFVGDDPSLHAANIFSPGAVISGYIQQCHQNIKPEPNQQGSSILELVQLP